jgi:hypothetical protein
VSKLSRLRDKRADNYAVNLGWGNRRVGGDTIDPECALVRIASCDPLKVEGELVVGRHCWVGFADLERGRVFIGIWLSEYSMI